MLVIRPVTLEDLPGVEDCAQLAGIGIVNLPKRRETLEKHIKKSINSFANHSSSKQGYYFFVLTDPIKGSIEGTCAIYSSIGSDHPLLVFEIKEVDQPYPPLPPFKETRLLCPKSYREGPSEVCALYLKRTMRQEGLGRLLSISRFLFMAAFPDRFSHTVIASMRGVTVGDKSPFWEGLGQHFLDLSFHEVMSMRSESEEFMSEVLPRYPVYVALLAPEVRELIGKVHPHTIPASQMLEKEGFKFTKEIDPIDGGPFLAAHVPSLRTVRDSKSAIVQEIHAEIVSEQKYIITNERLSGFRGCRAQMLIREGEKILLSQEIAEALQVNVGDSLRYID